MEGVLLKGYEIACEVKNVAQRKPLFCYMLNSLLYLWFDIEYKFACIIREI